MMDPCLKNRISVPLTGPTRRARERDWPRPPRRDPHCRLISQLLALGGPTASVIATSSGPWASATFVGARHRIILLLRGEDHEARADRLAKLLPEQEFAISGHIVADCCLDERITRPASGEANEGWSTESETLIRIAALTIEDW